MIWYYMLLHISLWWIHITKSIIQINNISNVFLSSLIIINTYVANYFVFIGYKNADIIFNDVQISHNMNYQSLPNDILNTANNFINAQIFNSNFINNTQRSYLFITNLNGSLILNDNNFVNNNISDSIINIMVLHHY